MNEYLPVCMFACLCLSDCLSLPLCLLPVSVCLLVSVCVHLCLSAYRIQVLVSVCFKNLSKTQRHSVNDQEGYARIMNSRKPLILAFTFNLTFIVGFTYTLCYCVENHMFLMIKRTIIPQIGCPVRDQFGSVTSFILTLIKSHSVFADINKSTISDCRLF